MINPKIEAISKANSPAYFHDSRKNILSKQFY